MRYLRGSRKVSDKPSSNTSLTTVYAINKVDRQVIGHVNEEVNLSDYVIESVSSEVEEQKGQ